jgi:hypothetical protein
MVSLSLQLFLLYGKISLSKGLPKRSYKSYPSRLNDIPCVNDYSKKY